MLVDRLRDQEVRELLEVFAVGEPIVAEGVAVAPETKTKQSWVFTVSSDGVA